MLSLLEGTSVFSCYHLPLEGKVKQHDNCSKGDKGTCYKQTLLVGILCCTINESPSNSCVKNEKGELEGEVKTLLTFSPPHKNCFAKWV